MPELYAPGFPQRRRRKGCQGRTLLLSSPLLSFGILDLRSHLVLLVLVLCHRPSCRLAGLPREVTAAARIGI